MGDSSWVPFSFLSNLECANPPAAVVEVLSLPGELIHAPLSAVLSQHGDSFTPLRSAPFPGALCHGGVHPPRVVTVSLPPRLFLEPSAARECLEKVSCKPHSVPRAASVLPAQWPGTRARHVLPAPASLLQIQRQIRTLLASKAPCKTCESLPGLGFRV